MITVDSRWVDTTKNDIVREEGVGGGGAVGGGRLALDRCCKGRSKP